MRRIVVDGVEYHWRSDSDFSYMRSPSVMILEGGAERGVKGDGAARMIRFSIPWRGDQTRPGWWIDPRVSITPKIVARAIQIANRTRASTLTTEEVFELLDLDRPRPDDRLRDLEAALANLPTTRSDVVAALLALGCHGDRGELIDDWFVCHADRLIAARAELQAIADMPWMTTDSLRVRSAFAFLDDYRTRVGLELVIETTHLDHRVVSASEPAPWGIPTSHHWWKQL